MASSLWVKICGVTSVEDAVLARDAGADALGLNFAPGSPRCITLERAAQIVTAVGRDVEWVGVFVDAEAALLERARYELGLDWLQLHGDETPAQLLEWGPRAFKALRIGDAQDVSAALAYGGERLLVDAKVMGAHGGTGASFDWTLLDALDGTHELVLAGGLRPDNVAEAVRRVRPFGIDTASGVESAPGKKDAAKVRLFVSEARRAFAEGCVL